MSGFNVLFGRKTLPVLNTALALVLAVAVMFFVRDLISLSFPAREISVKPESGKEAAGRRPLMDYAGILKNNPFGFPGGELKPLSAAAGPAVSRSDISLIGTIAGANDRSYAIFEDGSGNQDVFKTGSAVFGMGRLSRVEKGRVFIRANGTDLEIPLADVATVKEVKASSPGGSFGRKTGDGAYQIDMQSVQQAIDKPAQIMTDARFIPNMSNGKQEGYVLSEVKPGGIYASLGLRNGDILLRINEFNISNPEAALQAFTSLRGIDRAELDIIRNGAKMTMTYQIR